MSDPHRHGGGGTPAATLTRHNPPGLVALSYRGGRYAATLRRMLEGLPAQHGDDGRSPLVALNRDIHDDWAIALVHAWAVVTEVLGFYQERIINEGYLRTATEYRSVLELARAVGYEPRSGVAASTHLAFTVLAAKDEPAREVFLPVGVAVQSVPPQGRLPEIFETSAAFTGRAEWNAIRPELVAGRPAPEIRRNSAGVRLAGVSAGLQPGDAVLVLGQQPGGPVEPLGWLLAELRALTTDSQRGQTALSWVIPAGIGTAGEALSSARLFALRPPAGLFGYSRGGVYLLERPGEPWTPAALGMPALAVRALARDPSGALLAAADQNVFRSLDGGESWQPTGAGLARRIFHALAQAEGGLTYAGGDGGAVFLSTDAGGSWTTMTGEVPPPPARRGAGPLPRTVVRTLAAYRQGATDWLAAGTDDGVLRSTDRGRTWAPANDALPKVDPQTGLAPLAVRALAVARRGDKPALFAGTQAGVFHIDAPPSDVALAAGSAAAALLLVLLFGALSLLALIFQLAIWLPNQIITIVNGVTGAFAAQPLPRIEPAPGFDMYTWMAGLIAAVPLAGELLKNTFTIVQLIFVTDLLLVGLAIFLALALPSHARRALARTKAVSLGQPVQALAAGPDGRLYAGTEHGLFRSNDGDEQVGAYPVRIGRQFTRVLLGDAARFWRPVADKTLAEANVTTLAMTEAGALLAGLAGGALLRSTDGGATWEELGDAPLKAPLALLSLGEGFLSGGVPLDEPLERGWSRAELNGGLLDLDRPAPELAAGSLVLLCQPGRPQPAPAPCLRRVASAVTIDSRDPARPARLTRVALEAPGDLADFDRASLEVRALGPELSLYDDRPVGYAPDNRITCDRSVPGLSRGHMLVVSGRRLRACAPDGAQLRSSDGLRADALDVGEALVLLAAPASTANDQQEWRVRTREGRVGLLRCPPGALRLQLAADSDEIVSELAELAEVVHHGGRAVLTFSRPLANIYDRASVTIFGNLVPASHGATVKAELLGSSDAMSINQRFLLKQPPLTYVAMPEGVTSTLTVTVNGVRWADVPFLHRRARNQRVYMVRQDATAGPARIPPATAEGGPLSAAPPAFPASEIIFGDGVTGAGLPTGTWKIEAAYRSGIGTLGNLPAGSLSVLQSAPRGIKAVSNPLPAGGGVDPETIDEARTRASLGLRAMERIVAPADYEDFARAYPGVSKAKLHKIARGRRRLLHLTIADAEAGAGADTAFVDTLAGAIACRRAAPTPPLYVDRCETRYFHVRARLIVEPDHTARRDAILAQARGALVRAFGFAQRELAQAVAESEVIRVLQELAGVAAVELRALSLDGKAVAANRLLAAHPARLEGDRILPAQLLLINTTADDGIVLEVQP